MVKARITLLACAIGILMPAVEALGAHPLHSSFTEVKREASGVVSMSVRLFADDFSALLASLGATSQTAESVARQYVQRSLTLSTIDGRAIATQWCGMRSDQNLTWVCLRTTAPVAREFRMRNVLMFDRFSDQISIIRWTGSGTRTFVLSARVPESRLD